MLAWLRYRHELRKHKRRIRQIERVYEKDLSEVASLRDRDQIKYDMFCEMEPRQAEIDILRTRRLLMRAHAYSVPLPEGDIWEGVSPYRYLSSKGYARLRSAIRAERKARLELWLPLLSALTGLGGVAVAALTLWKAH